MANIAEPSPSLYHPEQSNQTHTLWGPRKNPKLQIMRITWLTVTQRTKNSGECVFSGLSGVFRVQRVQRAGILSHNQPLPNAIQVGHENISIRRQIIKTNE